MPAEDRPATTGAPQLEPTLDLGELEQLATELSTVLNAAADLTAYGRIIAREVTA